MHCRKPGIYNRQNRTTDAGCLLARRCTVFDSRKVATMTMKRRSVYLFSILLVILTLAGLAVARGKGIPAAIPESNRYFAIQVVDEQTGRGVPMVELQLTSSARYYTDSNGLVAFYEPGLMEKRVYFGVSSHGYEFAPDGFGSRGAVLETKPGGTALLKVKRLNIAERMYRITGQGIYRDTVLLGRKPPIAEPLLNAEITGQDGILTTIYKGKVYWFYGDTARLSYSMGNFAMTGATSDLPGKMDPAKAINLKYFVGKDGFARPMAPVEGGGVVWLAGVVTLPDDAGRERMAAWFVRLKQMDKILEQGFMVFNDEKEIFEKVKSVDLKTPIVPTHYPFPVTHADGTKYFYFPAPYPAVRVRADLTHYTDLSAYEAYTCLKTGTRYESKDAAQLDRDASGKLVWSWKRDTPVLSSQQLSELIQVGKMTREESPFRLQDAATGKPFLLHNASCFWNAYRKKYVMIASELSGATMLGELWYSEADKPEGPWVNARKIITHANKPGDAHDFYNPTHHPYLDQDGGHFIYLEGSYTNSFSGNVHPTPYYEYNQILYRLDLADPRLKLESAGSKE